MPGDLGEFLLCRVGDTWNSLRHRRSSFGILGHTSWRRGALLLAVRTSLPGMATLLNQIPVRDVLLSFFGYPAGSGQAWVSGDLLLCC